MESPHQIKYVNTKIDHLYSQIVANWQISFFFFIFKSLSLSSLKLNGLNVKKIKIETKIKIVETKGIWEEEK